MGIRSASGYVRTTIALPVHVLEGIDKAVKAGEARSRNELLTEAAERELKRLREEEIDRAFYDAANDPDLLEDDRQIFAEFETSDREMERLLAAEERPE